MPYASEQSRSAAQTSGRTDRTRPGALRHGVSYTPRSGSRRSHSARTDLTRHASCTRSTRITAAPSALAVRSFPWCERVPHCSGPWTALGREEPAIRVRGGARAAPVRRRALRLRGHGPGQGYAVPSPSPGTVCPRTERSPCGPLAVRDEPTQGADLDPGAPSRAPCEEVVGVSDGQVVRAGAGEPHGRRVGRPLLSLALASMMDEVHAHSGAVYLLAADEPVLEMAVMAGLPRAFAAPWERVGLSAPIPVAEAVRERRLVWVGGEEEMARRYPRIAVVLPYPFALAAVPVATASTVYGAVFVTWPGSHPPELSDREREHLTAACDRLAVRLERARRGQRPAARRDRICWPRPGRRHRPGRSARSRRRGWWRGCRTGCARSICTGGSPSPTPRPPSCSASRSRELLGSQLWAAVPWLNDPVYEDRYRAALLSQHATSFVALRPPGDWLSFRLYPSTTGLSVRISRAAGGGGDEPVRTAARRTRRPGWSRSPRC